MHLFYADESGTDVQLSYFVWGGVSVPDRQTRFIDADLSAVAQRFRPADTDDDRQAPTLNASAMHTGKGVWRKVNRTAARQAIKDALQLAVADRQKYGVRLFVAAIERKRLTQNRNPANLAFEQLTTRFDYMLGRLNRREDHPPERGLVLLNAASLMAKHQTLARQLSDVGYSSGAIKNLAEVPVALNRRNSRTLQLGGLVAYAVHRHFEHNDSQYFDLIKHCFDRDERQRYGLYAVSTDIF